MLLRIRLRKCSLKQLLRLHPVSPMWRRGHRWQDMQCTRFLDWQVKWSRIVKEHLGPRFSVWHRGRWHARVPDCSGEEVSLECTSIWSHLCMPQKGGCGKVPHVCWSADRLRKFPWLIFFLPSKRVSKIYSVRLATLRAESPSIFLEKSGRGRSQGNGWRSGAKFKDFISQMVCWSKSITRWHNLAQFLRVTFLNDQKFWLKIRIGID